MDDKEQSRRARQNIIALTILALIMLAGLWLLRDLKRGAELLACLSSGRRNCEARMSPAPSR